MCAGVSRHLPNVARHFVATRDDTPLPLHSVHSFPATTQQGGAMASIMVGLQAAGLALQDVPPLKFALFFGSVLTTHPRYVPAFRERVPVPSAHIIGHKD